MYAMYIPLGQPVALAINRGGDYHGCGGHPSRNLQSNNSQGKKMQDIIEKFVSPSGRQVRVIVRDGDPWFVAKDVCAALELANHRSSLALLDEDERGVQKMDTPSGRQDMTIVNEAGLYMLIFRSRRPEAKAFRRWVTHEVIPSIRKHGAYITPKMERNIAEHPEDAVALVSPKVAMALPEALEEFVTSVVSQAVQQALDERDGNVRRLERENDELRMENEELRHDAEAYRRWWKAWGDGMSRWRASKADPGQTKLWDDDRELLGEVR